MELAPLFMVTNREITAKGPTNRVYSVNNHGLTFTYSYSVTSTSNTFVTPLGGGQEVYRFSDPFKLVEYKDPLNRSTLYAYDSFARLSYATFPEGNGTQFTYDNRGNVVSTRKFPKLSSADPDIYTYASFDTTCSNSKTCNQPNWTSDQSGNVTDYTYDASHGGVLTVTQPAPGAGLPRPQVRYSYTALQAWYKNGSGVIAPSGVPIYTLTGISTCRTASSCVGTLDEIKLVIDYGTTASGNNLIPAAVSTQSGDGSLNSTTIQTYDLVGNALSIDGPISGPSDTVLNQYDILRRLTTTTYPDPDGSGSRQSIIRAYAYDSFGRLSSDKIQLGSTAYEAHYFTYDSANRLIKLQRAILGGGVPSVTQRSFDSLGRLDCVAVRMNPAAALPASACTASTLNASYGPDRITQYTYDSAGQNLSVITALGLVGQQRTEQTYTYSSNGMPLTVTDGNGNKTGYQYDGFDRPTRINYPDKSVTGQSSATDYEQKIYATPNFHQFRNRDGTWHQLTYDALGRLIVVDKPGTSAEDVFYSYDNHGRALSATYGSPGGAGIFNSYDGLGRLGSVTSFGRTLSYLYDEAGQVQRVTHPDGFYASYSYGVTGELQSVADSAGNLLATMYYDHLGRRNGIQRAPYTGGATTNIGFDYWFPFKIGTIINNFTDDAYDSRTIFSYNPAGQIRTREIDNDLPYSWSGYSNQSLSYVNNGLNQVTQVGAGVATFDALGNLLTGDAVFSFSYDIGNQLRTASSISNAVSLSYDPEGLLRRIDQTAGSSTEFLYDRGNLVAEYDGSGTLLRRYVHDDALDRPLVWYEGSGVSDMRWFNADERGSIVAVSDAAGNALSTFAYSSYGEPSSTIGSRFLYAGQPFIQEVGLQYSRTRFYSPALGKFLQADPIGYAAGLNRYAYVSGDPINYVDPWGLMEICSPGVSDQNQKNDCDLDELDDVSITAGRIPGSPGPGRGSIGGGSLGLSGGGSNSQTQKVSDTEVCPRVDPGSPGKSTEWRNFIWSPGWKSIYSFFSGRRSSSAAHDQFPSLLLWNDQGDAFRHFRWSFSMSRAIGPQSAAAFANAHEVSNPNPASETAMDLHNNAVGRAMGVDPRFSDLSPTDAGLLALRRGCLQTGLKQ